VTFGAFQGELRPLVEAAWKNHAGLLGVSVDDKAERDEFYRAHLWVACRVRSSKAADERQRGAILGHFRALVAAPADPPPQRNVGPSAAFRVVDISPAQEAAFWKLARRAHQAAQGREDADADAPFANWIAARLQEAFGRPMLTSPGHFHLGEDAHTRGFDTAMGALAVIAGDRYWIERTAEGTERRLRWQLARFLDDLSWLEGAPAGWSYVLGIHKTAHHGLPATMEDATTPQLITVLDALDTHIRRLCRRFGLRPCHCPTRCPSSFGSEQWFEWRYYHHPTPGHTRGPDGRLLQEKGAA
jgi:hypothetical protein